MKRVQTKYSYKAMNYGRHPRLRLEPGLCLRLDSAWNAERERVHGMCFTRGLVRLVQCRERGILQVLDMSPWDMYEPVSKHWQSQSDEDADAKRALVHGARVAMVLAEYSVGKGPDWSLVGAGCRSLNRERERQRVNKRSEAIQQPRYLGRSIVERRR